MMNQGQEFRLLCSVAAVELSPERVARIATAIKAGIDWKEFLRLTEHHGILPLAARNLKAAPGVPPEIVQSLDSAFETNVRRNLWFASELARIASHFDAKRIRAVSYKGPLLAESVYGDVALRNFGDLDFLIAPADLGAAKSALAELGYRPSEELSPATERFWQRYGYERSFDSAAGKYLVELQWGLTPHFFAVDLRAEGLLHRSRPVMVGGQRVWSLSPEDTLLVLCLHAAKHLWMRLIWLCDIAETIRTQAIDYALVLNRAQSLGILRIMQLSFWLTHQLLDGTVPPSAREIVLRDEGLQALGDMLGARLARCATYDFESMEYFSWIPRLRERPTDRSRYWWRLAWTPGVGDLAAVSLPPSMYPLYRIVRMARLVRRFALPSASRKP